MKTVFIFINDYNYKLVFTVNAYFTYNVECTAESTPTLHHIVKQKKKKKTRYKLNQVRNLFIILNSFFIFINILFNFNLYSDTHKSSVVRALLSVVVK